MKIDHQNLQNSNWISKQYLQNSIIEGLGISGYLIKISRIKNFEGLYRNLWISNQNLQNSNFEGLGGNLWISIQGL